MGSEGMGLRESRCVLLEFGRIKAGEISLRAGVELDIGILFQPKPLKSRPAAEQENLCHDMS